MQVTFSFAGEITQVLDAIPWVRCASGNVFIAGCATQTKISEITVFTVCYKPQSEN